MDLQIVNFDDLEAWLPIKPTVAMTSGGTTATATYHYDGGLYTANVSVDVARGLIAAYEAERGASKNDLPDPAAQA
jgi:hypothetical protein